MWKILRMICTVLSAVCLAALLPVGAFGDLPWVMGIGIGAAFFFVAMLFCKSKQEEQENPPEQKPDFLAPTHNEQTDDEEK
jgi:hypothetical protein